MGEPITKPHERSNGEWEKKWTDKTTGWHQDEVNPILLKFYESHFRPKIDGKPHVFVPLCGASLDMKWLIEQGCSVTGCEFARGAIEQFMTASNYAYTEVEWQNGLRIFRAKDVELIIVQGDLFALQGLCLPSPINAVWDRGSLVAINVFDQERYVKTLLSLAHDGPLTSLLVAVVFDDTVFGGPPHSVPESQVGHLFAADFDIEKVDSFDSITVDQKVRFKLDEMLEEIYVLTKKIAK